MPRTVINLRLSLQSLHAKQSPGLQVFVKEARNLQTAAEQRLRKAEQELAAKDAALEAKGPTGRAQVERVAALQRRVQHLEAELAAQVRKF